MRDNEPNAIRKLNILSIWTTNKCNDITCGCRARQHTPARSMPIAHVEEWLQMEALTLSMYIFRYVEKAVVVVILFGCQFFRSCTRHFVREMTSERPNIHHPSIRVSLPASSSNWSRVKQHREFKKTSRWKTVIPRKVTKVQTFLVYNSQANCFL